LLIEGIYAFPAKRIGRARGWGSVTRGKRGKRKKLVSRGSAGRGPKPQGQKEESISTDVEERKGRQFRDGQKKEQMVAREKRSFLRQVRRRREDRTNSDRLWGGDAPWIIGRKKACVSAGKSGTAVLNVRERETNPRRLRARREGIFPCLQGERGGGKGILNVTGKRQREFC